MLQMCAIPSKYSFINKGLPFRWPQINLSKLKTICLKHPSTTSGSFKVQLEEGIY